MRHTVRVRTIVTMQIATLERELEKERARGQSVMDELTKQTRMMDKVLDFRDAECSRETTDLIHENAELSKKLETWKERAQTLQRERYAPLRLELHAPRTARQLTRGASASLAAGGRSCRNSAAQRGSRQMVAVTTVSKPWQRLGTTTRRRTSSCTTTIPTDSRSSCRVVR